MTAKSNAQRQAEFKIRQKLKIDELEAELEALRNALAEVAPEHPHAATIERAKAAGLDVWDTSAVVIANLETDKVKVIYTHKEKTYTGLIS